jgi:hypothetical protein
MQTILLDCSGLRNIKVEKGDMPTTIYINGEDFLRNLETTLDRNRGMMIDDKQYEKQKRDKLRDMFAAKAMQTILTGSRYPFEEKVLEQLSEESYKIADAMLEAREKQ